MAKGGPRRSRKGAKGGRQPTSARDNGPKTSIVPWNQAMRLTDSCKLPTLTESVFKTIQTYAVTDFLISSTVADVTANYNAALAQFTDNLSALTALFDQYRIDVIEVFIKPGSGDVIDLTSGQTAPQLFTVLDFDDNNYLASKNAAAGYSTCIESEVNDAQRRCFKPRIAYAAYGSSAFTSYANQQAGWIDCASTQVVHYGVKTIVPQSDISTTWSLTARAHISFRSTH
jgi:hypothetical protein